MASYNPLKPVESINRWYEHHSNQREDSTDTLNGKKKINNLEDHDTWK